MDRLGLGYEDVKAVDPSVIYLSVSGFGNTGDSPYQSWPAYASIVEAMSGIYAWAQRPGEPPRPNPMGAIGDISSALFAVIGILAALRHRDRTGVGQYVDIAMLDAVVSMTDVVSNLWSLGQHPDEPMPLILDAFQAEDGYLNMQVVREHQFAALVDLIGKPEWKDDPRFAERSGWAEHLESDLRPAIEAWLADKTRLEATHLLSDVGIAAGPVHTSPEIIADEHVAKRHMIVEMERTDGVADPVLIPGNPVKLSAVAEGPETRVPWVGEHTAEVLEAELGLSDRRPRQAPGRRGHHLKGGPAPGGWADAALGLLRRRRPGHARDHLPARHRGRRPAADVDAARVRRPGRPSTWTRSSPSARARRRTTRPRPSGSPSRTCRRSTPRPRPRAAPSSARWPAAPTPSWRPRASRRPTASRPTTADRRSTSAMAELHPPRRDRRCPAVRRRLHGSASPSAVAGSTCGAAPTLRPRRLLRQLPEPSRLGARGGHRARPRPELRAGRGLVLVLRGPGRLPSWRVTRGARRTLISGRTRHQDCTRRPRSTRRIWHVEDLGVRPTGDRRRSRPPRPTSRLRPAPTRSRRWPARAPGSPRRRRS